MTQHPQNQQLHDQQLRAYKALERASKWEARGWGCMLALIVGGVLLAAGLAIAVFVALS